MLKLFLPDVGPMPQSTDWLSMTDVELNIELVQRGCKPRPNCARAIRKLVLLEKAELLYWLSLVAEHHGPPHGDLQLLTPVIARRMAVYREQLRGALARHEKELERKKRELEGLKKLLKALFDVVVELRVLLRARIDAAIEVNASEVSGNVESVGSGGE